MAQEPKQIIEFPAGGAISGTDVMLLQQGPLGTPLTHIQLSALMQQPVSTLTATTGTFAGLLTAAGSGTGLSVTNNATIGGTATITGDFAVATNKFTVAATTGNTVVGGTMNVTGASTLAALSATTGGFSSTATATAFIPSSSATVPTNGMYLPAANTLGWAINSAAEMQLTASALSPAVSDGVALGTSSLMWGDLFLASGGVINFNASNVTITHSAAALGIAGATVTVTRNSTDGSGTTIGLSVLGAQSVAHTGLFYGASIAPSYSASSGNTLASFYGISSNPVNAGTGTITAFFGTRSEPMNASSGTVGTMRAVDGISRNLSSGTVTDMYAGFFRCDNTGASGTVTNAFGVYVATPNNSGTMTNKWGLYQQDTASKNFLAGRTLIGTVTDDASTNLQVNGTFKATGASTLAALSATTGAFTGATTVNLSGTAISFVSGFVFGAAAADGLNTGVLLDAVDIHPRYILRRANGTSVSRTAVMADDVLGALEGRGYDGSAFTGSHAGIDFVAAQNWSGAARGGKIAFRTTTNGATTGAGVKMTLENSGALLIGGTTDDGTNKLRVSGGVTVDTGNSYKVNDVAVVGVRKTGWAAATGTATRTTFVTSTVTTEQLAERLKALIDDLISHGLIGA